MPEWKNRGTGDWKEGMCLKKYHYCYLFTFYYPQLSASFLTPPPPPSSFSLFCLKFFFGYFSTGIILYNIVIACKCIRAVPECDLTNGFFVAMFERIQNNLSGDTTGGDIAIDVEEHSGGVPKTTLISRCGITNSYDGSINCNDAVLKKKLKRSQKSTVKKERDCNNASSNKFENIHRKKRKKRGGVKKPVTL